ncbi:MAG: PASTA domain-containing protein [Actinobacteria bacterium]|nr:PASTA domain-containing protein [Actinomycetota bacterium]NBP53425.1 PASTA domain-containing protein [Actinomycetota bacterium]
MDTQRDLIGYVLAGRYRLTTRLGLGASDEPRGMFDALDIRTNVAVRVRLTPLNDLVDPRSSNRRTSGDARRAIQHHLQLVLSTRHPALAPISDWGDTDLNGVRCIYTVLGQLPGGSLREMLDRGRRLTPSQALVVGLDICRALNAVHGAGWVHGDIRPATIVFDANRRARLGGLDTLTPENIGEADIERARYAAPEVGQGSPPSPGSDVYSLALALVEAVTGDVPFNADSVTVALSNRVDKLLPVNADLGALASVLERAARPDVDSRFSAREFGEALVGVAKRVPPPTPIDVVGVDELLIPMPPTNVIDHGDAGDPTGEIARPMHTAIDKDKELASAAQSRGHSGELDDPTGEIAAARVSRLRGRKIVAVVAALAVVGGAVAGYFLLKKDSYQVPVLVGLTQGEAENLIVNFDWKVVVQEGRSDVVETGQIIATDPSDGRMLQEGKSLTIVVSQGPTFSTLEDFSGKTIDEATRRIEELGLVVVSAKINDENSPAGTVLKWAVAEQPAASVGDQVVKGTTITLTVSDGPAPRVVPNLVGLDPAEAEAKIVELGLTVTKLADDIGDADPGKVGGQVPAAGESVPRGGSVSYWVSKGKELTTIPYVQMEYKATVEKRLTEAGFVIGNVTGKAATHRLKKLFIAGVEVKSGDEVAMGATIDLEFYGA